MSTVGWKRWNCLGWRLAEFCGRGAGWYSCGTSTSPFVILYIMVSLLWSLRVCRGSHPRSDTIADMETGGLLHRKGMFFTNRAARRCVISSLSSHTSTATFISELCWKLTPIRTWATSIQSASKKAQHAVCRSTDLINVLIPAKSAIYCDI